MKLCCRQLCIRLCNDYERWIWSVLPTKTRFCLNAKRKFSSISYTQPNVEVVSKPESKGTNASVQISGYLHDGSADPFFQANVLDQDTEKDLGIEEVIVFHNENKIYYKHEPQQISKVPFVVDARRHEGENHFISLYETKCLTNTKHISYFMKKIQHLPVQNQIMFDTKQNNILIL